MKRIPEESLLKVLTLGSWLLLGTLTLAALLFGTRPFAAGVLAGGLLAIANFYWLRSALEKVLQLPVEQAGRSAIVRYVLRLAFLALAIGGLISYTRIDLLGLLLGLSVLVIAIIVLTVYLAFRKGE